MKIWLRIIPLRDVYYLSKGTMHSCLIILKRILCLVRGIMAKNIKSIINYNDK